MKKIAKVLCIILCSALVLAMLYLAIAFLGNPVSYILTKRSASQYMEENFGDSDFKTSAVGYNFKTGDYYVNVDSPTSQDSYFTIYFDGLGRYRYDTYDSVTDEYNTYSRVNQAYWDLVRTKLYEGNSVFDCSISFGEIKTNHKEIYSYVTKDGITVYYRMDKDYGLDISTLELDKEHDIHSLGRDYGRICFYVHDPEVTVDRAAELLLEVKNYLDASNIPFQGIDFHLCEPRNTDGQSTGKQIDLFDFLYADIYEEDLIIRVEEHWESAQEHYAIQDAETERLVKEFQESQLKD